MALLKVHPRMIRPSAALVKASTNQSIPDSSWIELTWDLEEYDDDAWHDTVINSGRLTVPSGVARVRVSAGLRWGSNSLTGIIQGRIKRNDTTFPGQPQTGQAPSGKDTMQLASGMIPVVPGDYFTAEVRQTSGASHTFEKSANASSANAKGIPLAVDLVHSHRRW